MSVEMHVFLRRPGLIAVVAALGLAACGGSGDEETTKADAPVVTGACPADGVAPVAGYPVYRVLASAADLVDPVKAQSLDCAVLRHYEAGYAIVADEGIDPDPWSDADAGVTVGVAQHTVENPDENQSYDDMPIKIEGFRRVDGQGERTVYARRPGGLGEPWECRTVGVIQALDQGAQDCLDKLRSSVLLETGRDQVRSADPSVRASGSASAGEGAALVDTTQWTALGRYTKNFPHYDSDPMFDPGPAYKGVVTTDFDIYRLNSLDSDDYFLVKVTLATTPNFAHGCNKWEVFDRQCYFYNKSHRVSFVLKRKHGKGAAIAGDLVDYSPRNVVAEQTYNTKIAGGLKTSATATEKGAEIGTEYSLSGEISTSYTYRSAEIRAREAGGGEVGFEVSHDESGNAFSSTGLYASISTTISTMRGTYWVLYKFSRDARDTQSDAGLVLEVHNQSGMFGKSENGFIKRRRHSVYDIRDEKNGSVAYTAHFALPHFSVEIGDGQGGFMAPPRSLSAPLKLRPGQDVFLKVDAGGSPDAKSVNQSHTHPIALSWQMIARPDIFTVSRESGNKKTEVEATVSPNAKAGEKGFLRFNTVPRGAAPGLQEGDFVIPYEIVAAH